MLYIHSAHRVFEQPARQACDRPVCVYGADITIKNTLGNAEGDAGEMFPHISVHSATRARK